jgi:putative nucleotidyltransferase-like protein
MDLAPQQVASPRRWLAAILRGTSPAGAPCGISVDELVAAAQAEGVVTLVAERMQSLPVFDPLRQAFSRAGREATAISMLRASECLRVLALFEAAGIRALLMKGSALAWWLYPAPHLRECSDIDLLLESREAVAAAVVLLAAHGYDDGYVQGDQAYEQVSRRALSGTMQLDLDLHWALSNAPVFAHMLEPGELFAASIPLPALGPGARGLAPEHVLLHACMHRAINLYTGVGDSLKWLYDLHLLAPTLTPAQWQAVVQLCSERGLGSVCLSGMDEAAVWFGEAAPVDALSALRVTRRNDRVDGTRLDDWRYMHRRNLAALPGIRARLAWLWRKLFPHAAHLRQMYGTDKRLAALWRKRAMHLLGNVLGVRRA